MSDLRLEMLILGSGVAAAGILMIVASRSLARMIFDATWRKLGFPFRPRIARMGIIGAGVGAVFIGGSVIVLMLTVAASA